MCKTKSALYTISVHKSSKVATCKNSITERTSIIRRVGVQLDLSPSGRTSWEKRSRVDSDEETDDINRVLITRFQHMDSLSVGRISQSSVSIITRLRYKITIPSLYKVAALATTGTTQPQRTCWEKCSRVILADETNRSISEY